MPRRFGLDRDHEKVVSRRVNNVNNKNSFQRKIFRGRGSTGRVADCMPAQPKACLTDGGTTVSSRPGGYGGTSHSGPTRKPYLLASIFCFLQMHK